MIAIQLICGDIILTNISLDELYNKIESITNYKTAPHYTSVETFKLKEVNGVVTKQYYIEYININHIVRFAEEITKVNE